MSDFEDEARRRSQLLYALEGHTGPLVDEDADDLDVADHILGAMPGGQASSLDAKLSLRDAKWNTLNKIAPFARANPPSVLQGIIGNQQPVILTAENFLNPPKPEVANWGGDDAETLPVTVVFAPVQQVESAIQLIDFRPVGIVQFGTRGMAVKAEVDIGTGVQFTVNASTVILQVTLDPDPTAVFPPGTGTIATARLAGMLSFWPTTHNLSLTRTKFTSIGPLGATVTVAIPPFARNVMVYRVPDSTPFTIGLLNSLGAPVYTRSFVANAFLENPIALPINAVTVSLTAPPAPTGTSFVLVFGLAF